MMKFKIKKETTKSVALIFDGAFAGYSADALKIYGGLGNFRIKPEHRKLFGGLEYALEYLNNRHEGPLPVGVQIVTGKNGYSPITPIMDWFEESNL